MCFGIKYLELECATISLWFKADPRHCTDFFVPLFLLTVRRLYPLHHRHPAPSRKENPFTKDSISTPGPSGLKNAARKALNRVTVKPSGGHEVHTPSSGSTTTQDAFAKFRAMVSGTEAPKHRGSYPKSWRRSCGSCVLVKPHFFRV